MVLRVADDLLTVSDHGPGFPPALLAHATDRFVVGDAARGKGVGLGLSIVAEHARTLKAELTLKNAAEGGAVVSVHFPRRNCVMPASRVEPP